MSINIERCLATDGWLTELEATYLAQSASKSRIIVEVGSWMGRSTCALAANVQEKVWAVDTWEGSEEHIPMLAGKPKGWLYEQFLRNTRGLPVNPVVLPSVRAAEYFAMDPPMKVDMVFIDANHKYESVKADIQAWMPLLNDGGILCGHDFDPVYWRGIVQAVKECVPNFKVMPNTTIWSTEEDK